MEEFKATYIQRADSIDHTPEADVAAGDVVTIGKHCFIAKLDIPAGTLGALATTGVFDVAKKGDEAITAGADLYWDAAAKGATATAGENAPLGVAIEDAETDGATVRVLKAGV